MNHFDFQIIELPESFTGISADSTMNQLSNGGILLNHYISQHDPVNSFHLFHIDDSIANELTLKNIRQAKMQAYAIAAMTCGNQSNECKSPFFGFNSKGELIVGNNQQEVIEVLWEESDEDKLINLISRLYPETILTLQNFADELKINPQATRPKSSSKNDLGRQMIELCSRYPLIKTLEKKLETNLLFQVIS